MSVKGNWERRGGGLLLAFVGLEPGVGDKDEYEAEHAAPDAGVGPGVDDTGPLESEKKAGEAGENEDCARKVGSGDLLPKGELGDYLSLGCLEEDDNENKCNKANGWFELVHSF